jgi:hypothetical protein
VNADHHHNYGATEEAAVVLDIGADTGAIVVRTPPALCGHEIDLVRRGEDTPYVHTAVRERHLPGGTVLAAIFAAVPAGEYTLAGVGARPSISVTVAGGRVTDLSV